MNTPLIIAALAAGGAFYAGRRWAQRVERGLHDEFRRTLLDQASAWLEGQLHVSAADIRRALEDHLAGQPADARLARVLRIEWEACPLDRQRCEVRVVIALNDESAVRLGTITTQWAREDLPDFLRHELLVRCGREATFILLDRSQAGRKANTR